MRKPWILVGGAVGLIVAIVAFSYMYVFGVGLFKQSTAEFRGQTGQREQVHANPNYRIATYDHFFNLCADVQTKEATIAALKAEKTDGVTPDRASQIGATITALTGARADSINTYNADAHKTDTQANFHASNLPYQLSITTQGTQCVAQ